MLDRLEWQPLSPDESARLIGLALHDVRPEPLQDISIEGRIAALSFYNTYRLAWLKLRTPGQPNAVDLFLLSRDVQAYLLDSKSEPIHNANEADPIKLTADTVADYLRFFCMFVYGDAGPFQIVEQLAPPRDGASDDAPERAEFGKHIQPLASKGQDEEGWFRFLATVFYGGMPFRSEFAVSTNGLINMVDDEPLPDGVSRDLIPPIPIVHPADVYLKMLRLRHVLTASGSSIQETLVAVLMEHALAQQVGHRLIAHFNAKVANRSSLEQFAELVATTSPVVVIESSIPFVEEVVAGIITAQRKGQPAVAVVRGEADGGDDTRMRVSLPKGGPVLALLPMHAYRSIVDVLRVSHQLAAEKASVVIGCERFSELPASLREIVDLTLRLPPLTPTLFESLFLRVFSVPLPPGWQRPDTHWIGQLLHTDFEHPFGFKLTPDEALKYIREQVEERLRAVDPVAGLGLKDLHGLGEARLFAEDLIADIHQAMAGRLAWSNVDRGVLLAGPPGTGKTTLARAIAKDCGIKFVFASAASWQAVGHLGDHIRAIRADFAQARRYAPSILFLDEIDSVGNREQFSGDNAQYNVQVVNAILEQMQGLDATAPVIVIAATNHLSRVDAALRRAGRLDRVIEIPYPNTEALAAIFRHYLRTHAKPDELAPDVDTQLLGQMSFGLSGADVEFMVRGAARRARRAGRAMNQGDLLDEITGKPRDSNSSVRLAPEEIERIALHEAGHALARCLSNSRGKDITFVSILPRMNGTLGFVAHAPSDRNVQTRKDYMEHLEIFLAGRAAEALQYGEDGVSSGARSDLIVATDVAKIMVSQCGLGPDGSLMWTDTPTAAHLVQAEKTLAQAYNSIKSKLGENERCLLSLAQELRQRQELTGPEVLRIIGS